MTWTSLFTAPNDALAGTLHDLLAAQGYERYDPFPGGTGTPPALTAMVRLFVAPSQDGWVRVLGEFPEARIMALSQQLGQPVLFGWLAEDSGGFALFDKTARHDDPAAFAPYLAEGHDITTLEQAFAGQLAVEAIAGSEFPGDGPPVIVADANNLPPELAELAREQGVDPGRVGKMLEKQVSGLFGKLRKGGGDPAEQEQAKALFMGGGKDLWNSLHGQRVRAIASVLKLPANWRTPDWQAVRDAYQVYRLRERSPRMPLMPGDRETMDAVPNALAYTPVYVGRK